MTKRGIAAALVHMFVATYYTFAEHVTWLPSFTKTLGWVVVLWVVLFASGFICARENRGLALAIPLAASVLALTGLSVVETLHFSPGWWAAPLVVVIWMVGMFWPSLLGIALGSARAS
jgi:hypothetical protein